MPNYEFLCRKCEKPFERAYSFKEYAQAIRKKVQCPACGSRKVMRQMSVVQIKTAKKS